MSADYPRPGSWIPAADGVVFKCQSGFVQREKGGIPYCLSAGSACPIGENLRRVKSGSTTGLIRIDAAEAGDTESCVIPLLASMKAVAGKANEVVLECAASTYAVAEAGAGESLLRCAPCPMGTTSSRGAKDVAACFKSCLFGQGVDPDDANKCRACGIGEDIDPATGKCAPPSDLAACLAKNKFLAKDEAAACIGEVGRIGDRWAFIAASSPTINAKTTGFVGPGVYKMEGYVSDTDCSTQVFAVSKDAAYSLAGAGDAASITLDGAEIQMANGNGTSEIHTPGITRCVDFTRKTKGVAVYRYKM
jgi:hypothetical protein